LRGGGREGVTGYNRMRKSEYGGKRVAQEKKRGGGVLEGTQKVFRGWHQVTAGGKGRIKEISEERTGLHRAAAPSPLGETMDP